MPRHFSLPSVLRMVPNELLKQFFERLDIELKCMDWKRLPGRFAEPLLLALSWEGKDSQTLAESALRDVFELSCPSGRETLAEAARQLNVEFRLPDRSPYACSMWAWLHHPEVFQRAHLMHQAARVGRWRRRQDLPCIEPQTSPEALAELKARLSELLKRHQGRGHQCTIQHFRREDRVDYYVAWLDDFVQTVITHDAQGQLRQHSLRPTFEMVFAFTAAEGTLDLYAKLPSPLKPELECLFAEVLLNYPLEANPQRRTYDLNRLRDFRAGFPVRPEDRVHVRLTQMRLLEPNTGRQVMLKTGRTPTDDIFRVMDEFLDENQWSLDNLSITRATLAFEFQGTHPAGGMTFDLWTNACNLRNQPRVWSEMAFGYLKQWKIHRG